METALAGVRERFVAKLGSASDCTFDKLTQWLQAYVDTGGQLLGKCLVRAEALAPVLTKTDQKSGWLKATMKAPMKTIPQRWDAVEAALNKGQALVVEGRGTEISGDKSKFANSTGFHAFVLLQVIEDGDGKKWFIGFDPDVSATTETQKLWNNLIRAAFDTTDKDEDLGKWNEKVKDLKADKLYEILTTMVLGTTTSGFGPLVRGYAIDRTKELEGAWRG